VKRPGDIPSWPLDIEPAAEEQRPVLRMTLFIFDVGITGSAASSMPMRNLMMHVLQSGVLSVIIQMPDVGIGHLNEVGP
jgi:hypothetical protein